MRLPAELRIRIWSLAAENRILRINFRFDNTKKRQVACADPPMRDIERKRKALASVCRETRYELERHLFPKAMRIPIYPSRGTVNKNPLPVVSVPFHPLNDVIVIDSSTGRVLEGPQDWQRIPRMLQEIAPASVWTSGNLSLGFDISAKLATDPFSYFSFNLLPKKALWFDRNMGRPATIYLIRPGVGALDPDKVIFRMPHYKERGAWNDKSTAELVPFGPVPKRRKTSHATMVGAHEWSRRSVEWSESNNISLVVVDRYHNWQALKRQARRKRERALIY